MSAQGRLVRALGLSLTILAKAGHMLTDVAGILIALVGHERGPVAGHAISDLRPSAT